MNAGASGPSGPGHDDLDRLVGGWLTLPDAAQRLGVDVTGVRRLVQERFLIAVRRGERSVLSVPVDLLDEDRTLAQLPGTLTVLHDAGFDDVEALQWLLTDDETLPGSPLQALRAGRKTEVRRRAQALAF